MNVKREDHFHGYGEMKAWDGTYNVERKKCEHGMNINLLLGITSLLQLGHKHFNFLTERAYEKIE